MIPSRCTEKRTTPVTAVAPSSFPTVAYHGGLRSATAVIRAKEVYSLRSASPSYL